jgi:hypothetical protein
LRLTKPVTLAPVFLFFICQVLPLRVRAKLNALFSKISQFSIDNHNKIKTLSHRFFEGYGYPNENEDNITNYTELAQYIKDIVYLVNLLPRNALPHNNYSIELFKISIEIENNVFNNHCYLTYGNKFARMMELIKLLFVDNIADPQSEETQPDDDNLTFDDEVHMASEFKAHKRTVRNHAVKTLSPPDYKKYFCKEKNNSAKAYQMPEAIFNKVYNSIHSNPHKAK